MDQVLAVIWVRARLLVNTLRLKSSGWEILAAVLTLVGSLTLSLGIAALLGLGTWHGSEEGEDPEGLFYGIMACFWTCSFFGVLMPLILSTGASGIDATRLKMFPLSRPKLAFMSWGSAFCGPDHLFYYPSLVICLGVAVRASSGLGFAGVLAFLLMTILIVTWSTGLVAFVQGILRHRRGKEIAGLVGVSLIVLLSLTPAFLTRDLDEGSYETRAETHEALNAQFKSVVEATDFLPPTLAAQAVTASASGDLATAWTNLGWLALWIAVGLLVAYAIFVRNLEGSEAGRNTSPTSKGAGRFSNFDITRTFPRIPAEVLAITSKELRYLLRSTVGKFNLLMLPVLCALFCVIFHFEPGQEGPIPGANADQLMMYGLLMYGLLFTNNFVSNSVGWEGPGFKVYLLAPVAYERVLVGKNLGVWLYGMLLYVEVLLFWILLASMPPLSLIVSSALLFASCLILFTMVGNFSSLAFPVARDISSMKSQPSQPAILISMLAILALGGVVLFLIGVPVALGLELGHIIPLVVLFASAILIYKLSLRHAAELFQRKKGDVLAKLESGS